MVKLVWLMVLSAVAWSSVPVTVQAMDRPAAQAGRVAAATMVAPPRARRPRTARVRRAPAAVRLSRLHARSHRRFAPVDAGSPATLRSSAVMILDPASGAVLFEKNSDSAMPIASLTKLMTALVVVESHQDMDQLLAVSDADVDRLKHSSSRLRVGTRLTRATMLHIALMSSENRAASALGRNYPGGETAFVAAMNAKAAGLGMTQTHYVEPTGLSSANVSTAADLAKLVIAAQRQPLIRAYSTDHDHTIRQGGRATAYRNTNRLISNRGWQIGLQKTGYINEAGRCMVLHATIRSRAVVMVFLDAQGKFSRAADANRVRAWLAAGHMTAQR